MLWLEAFVLTLAGEEAIALPLLRSVERSIARRAMAVLIANLSTHPLVWFFFTRLGLSYVLGASVAEVWAFGFEIVVYRVIFPEAPWRRCALASVAAIWGRSSWGSSGETGPAALRLVGRRVQPGWRPLQDAVACTAPPTRAYTPRSRRRSVVMVHC